MISGRITRTNRADIDYATNIAMGPLLVASWDLFVYELFKICRSAQRRSPNPGKPINNQNYSMGRAEKDLARFSISVPTKSDLWCEAGHIGQIRNRLVHTGGTLERTASSKLLQHTEDNGLVVIPDGSDTLQSNPKIQTEPFQLYLSKKYCLYANENLRQLLFELLKICEDHLNSTP